MSKELAVLTQVKGQNTDIQTQLDTIEAQSVISSIQEGSTNLAAGANTTITITSVDTSKSILIVSCANSYAGSSGSSLVATIAGGRIASATSIFLQNGTGAQTHDSGNTTVYWQVIEYN